MDWKKENKKKKNKIRAYFLLKLKKYWIKKEQNSKSNKLDKFFYWPKFYISKIKQNFNNWLKYRINCKQLKLKSKLEKKYLIKKINENIFKAKKELTKCRMQNKENKKENKKTILAKKQELILKEKESLYNLKIKRKNILKNNKKTIKGFKLDYINLRSKQKQIKYKYLKSKLNLFKQKIEQKRQMSRNQKYLKLSIYKEKRALLEEKLKLRNEKKQREITQHNNLIKEKQEIALRIQNIKKDIKLRQQESRQKRIAKLKNAKIKSKILKTEKENAKYNLENKRLEIENFDLKEKCLSIQAAKYKSELQKKESKRFFKKLSKKKDNDISYIKNTDSTKRELSDSDYNPPEEESFLNKQDKSYPFKPIFNKSIKGLFDNFSAIEKSGFKKYDQLQLPLNKQELSKLVKDTIVQEANNYYNELIKYNTPIKIIDLFFHAAVFSNDIKDVIEEKEIIRKYKILCSGMLMGYPMPLLNGVIVNEGKSNKRSFAFNYENIKTKKVMNIEKLISPVIIYKMNEILIKKLNLGVAIEIMPGLLIKQNQKNKKGIEVFMAANLFRK